MASPVERILGPGTSPDSMRSRSRRVFSHMDPMSNTLVNPYRVSMSWSCRLSSGTGIPTAFAHFLSKKCTWLFQKPAATVKPEQSSNSVF